MTVLSANQSPAAKKRMPATCLFWSGLRICVLLLALCAGSQAWAATNTWTGTAGDGLWSSGGNWSLGHAPTSTEDVVIATNGVSINVNSVSSSIASLSITKSATLTLNANLTVTGNVTISGAGTAVTVAGGSGTLTVNGTFSAGTADANVSYTQTGGTVHVLGAVTIGATGKSNITFVVSGGYFKTDSNFTMNCNSNGVFTVSGSTGLGVAGNFTLNGGITGTITSPGHVYLNPTSVKTISGGATLAENGNLPVTFDRMRARAADGAVLVEWHVASEVENAGFHLWRRPAGGSGWAWVRANDGLIPGRLSNPEPRTYRFLDKPEAGLWEYRIETVALDDAREFFSSKDAVAWSGEGLVDETIEPAELAEPFGARLRADARALRTTDLAGAASPEQTAVLPAARKAPSADVQAQKEAVDAPEAEGGAMARGKMPKSGDAAKALYTGRGVLLVPAASMPAGFDATRSKIYRGGFTVHALGIVKGDLALYAPGYADRYTENDAFFLYPQPGKTKTQKLKKANGLFKGQVDALDTETNTVTGRYEEVYFNFTKKPLTYEPWISSQFLAQDGAGSGLASFTLTLPNLVAGEASLQATVFGHSDAVDELGDDHALQVFVNGTLAGNVTWEAKDGKVTFTFPNLGGVLAAGDNTVELVTPPLDGIASQLGFVYSLSATYPMALQGPGPLVIDGSAGGSSTRVYEVSGLDTDALWIVDARRPEKANLIAYETRDDGGSFTARFKVKGGKWGPGDGILVVPHGEELAPLDVSARTIERLSKNIGYLATGPAQFEAALQPLLDQRAAEGLAPAFVGQEALFDAYNFGRYGPEGIRQAVREVQPDFLLLAGRTHWDYLNRENSGIDPLVPTVLEATSRFGEAPCDARYGDLGNGFAEVAVGRFPVNDEAELAVAVQRTLDHVASGGSNGTRGLAVADENDGFDLFDSQAAHVVFNVPEIEWTQANLGSTEYPDAASITEAMKDAANGDADVILFVGHGSSTKLSKSNVLDAAKCADWTGNVVLLQATCTANYTIHNLPGQLTNAGTLLTQAQGGIAASIATTTYTNSIAGMNFMTDLLGAAQRGSATWGEALVKAQREAFKRSKNGGINSELDADMAKTECLLGDPALPCAP